LYLPDTLNAWISELVFDCICFSSKNRSFKPSPDCTLYPHIYVEKNRKALWLKALQNIGSRPSYLTPQCKYHWKIHLDLKALGLIFKNGMFIFCGTPVPLSAISFYSVSLH